MSNWIDYKLEILAPTPREMNQIADRLDQPSQKLARWIAEQDGSPLDQVTAALKRI